MELLPEAAGPQDPIATTSPRRPGSIRRTTNIDTLRPDGLRAAAVVDARARDLRTAVDGTTTVVGEAWLRAVVSPTRELLELQTTPSVPALQGLLGGSVGPGFRTRFGALATEGCEEGSLLYLLLDDLTGATLVSGYALTHGGALDPEPGDQGKDPDPHPHPHPHPKAHPIVDGETPVAPVATPVEITLATAPQFSFQEDICAGWAHDATMMLHLRDTGLLPVPIGPPAPHLERADDPLSWHPMAPLPPHAVRRRRRLDLMELDLVELDLVEPDLVELDLVEPNLVEPERGSAHHAVEMHFRDSHVDEGGLETVLHEYTLTGTVDPVDGRVVTVVARVQVLPWMECPSALASAQRIDGMALGDLRLRVRREFVGRSTCTHLNDSLRSLADVPALYRGLEPGAVA